MYVRGQIHKNFGLSRKCAVSFRNATKYSLMLFPVLGSTFTLSIITAVVLGGTLSTGGKGSIIGTALASLVICIMRFGLPFCFGVSTQNLDLPIGVMLVAIIAGRAIVSRVKLSPGGLGKKLPARKTQ